MNKALYFPSFFFYISFFFSLDSSKEAFEKDVESVIKNAKLFGWKGGLSRIKSEFASLQRDSPDGVIEITAVNESILVWRVVMQCLEHAGPFSDHIIVFDVTFGENYPYQQPVVRFVDKIFHPNVDFNSGLLCSDGKWSVVYDMRVFLLTVRSLITYPSVLNDGSENPINIEAAALYSNERDAYFKRCQAVLEEKTSIHDGLSVNTFESLLHDADIPSTASALEEKTRCLVSQLQGHSDRVNSVSWSPDGFQLASASVDKTVRIWDARTGEEVSELQGHSGSVTSVSWSPDGSQLASASFDKTVRIWDARTGEEVSELQGHSGEVILES